MAFDGIARLLPESFGRYLSPGRYGLRYARPLVKSILGTQKLVAVDVGAASGILPHWYNIDGIALIYQIDPRAAACQELEAINRNGEFSNLYRIIQAAVTGDGAQRTLYVSNTPTGTSLFAPDFSTASDAGAYVSMEYFLPMSQETIETKTLETLLGAANEDRVDLIKLDIQGAELEALRGLGADRLKNLLCAEVEVGMSDIYPEVPGFADIQKFMAGSDFELFDVRVARSHLPHEGKHGYFQTSVFHTPENDPTISAKLVEFDAVYFRKRSALLAEGDGLKIRRMLICYMTYNFFAEAYSLVLAADRQRLFTDQESERLRDLIVKVHSVREGRPWLRNTPFWNKVRKMAYRIAPRNAPRWCQYMYQNYPSG